MDGTDPSDDTDWSDNTFNVKVNHGMGAYSVTGLDSETLYSFDVYPYTNSGSNTDFKTDGTVPSINTTTSEAFADPIIGDLMITEVCGTGAGTGDGFMEIYNTTDHNISLVNVQARYWNGNNTGATPSPAIDLSGSIPPLSFVVIVRNSSDFNIAYGFAADFSNTNFYLNGGDDGCDIYNSNTSTILDAFNDNGTTASGHVAWYWEDNSVWERTSTGDGAIQSNWTEYTVGEGTPKTLLSISFDGSTSNVWSTSSNWDKILPGAYQNVTIPQSATNYPTITAAATCNNLTIESNASGDASLIGQGNLTVSGTTIVQRYATAALWHGFSSPVSGADFNSLYLDGSPDVWGKSYNESTNLYTYASTLTTQLGDMKGWMLWIDGSTAQTFDITGNIRSGTIGTADNMTNQAGDASHGYNFVGNPFPSAIDWNAAGWTKTNIGIGFWILNDATNQWMTYNGMDGLNGGTQYISSGQSFFVQV